MFEAFIIFEALADVTPIDIEVNHDCIRALFVGNLPDSGAIGSGKHTVAGFNKAFFRKLERVRIKLTYDHLLNKNRKLEALAKHIRAAMQRYQQPGAPAANGYTDEEDLNDGDGMARLTRREMEILALLARGLSNEVISKQLYISPTTTRNHIQNILGKLGVHSKLEAVASAVRAGYIDFAG